MSRTLFGRPLLVLLAAGVLAAGCSSGGSTISAGVQQFIGSFGLNVSGGGAVFAAFVIATAPMFLLIGCTMRYFVSGLTEGATKL